MEIAQIVKLSDRSFNGNKSVAFKYKKNKQSKYTRRKYGKDEIEISETGKVLCLINETLKNISDIRKDKVKEISSKIDAGTYNVDSKSVAEKMISFFLYFQI